LQESVKLIDLKGFAEPYCVCIQYCQIIIHNACKGNVQ